MSKNIGFGGRNHTEEWKINHSADLIGRKYSEEHKKHISLGLKGKKKSLEHRKKMSLAKLKNGIGIYKREWEKTNGKISKGFIIHHIDKNRKNNNPNNLIVISREEHFKLHQETKKCK